MLFRKKLSHELKSSLDAYIRSAYAPENERIVCEESAPYDAAPIMRAAAPTGAAKSRIAGKKAVRPDSASYETPHPYSARMPSAPAPTAAVTSELEHELRMLDESFQEMLLRKIDEKGIKDSECYKRAGVDRKLFSKIRSNPLYRPKKTTVIAFCIALELEYDEAEEMLRKAGYALSHSSKFDVIVKYFLIHRRYDLQELNIALYEYDQCLIG